MCDRRESRGEVQEDHCSISAGLEALDGDSLDLHHIAEYISVLNVALLGIYHVVFADDLQGRARALAMILESVLDRESGLVSEG